MIKLEFVFDIEKINRDKLYHPEDIYNAMRSAYQGKGIPEIPGEEGSLWFCDANRDTDMANMMSIVFALAKKEWFMRYIQRLYYYDTDDESENDDVLDVLYRRFGLRINNQ